ncbi:hypothetical protein OU798_01265 [Prolixibacteraceae bacterium Z1-6]|uniref:Uncharacterized protein n=1 Tax=Draconibacterium aestuarii TaxID=2998507 RepID=A0A9X3J5U5_9BACT|nr:hypothetical protein [Prolixibacteraceae bacterium Z1-6]
MKKLKLIFLIAACLGMLSFLSNARSEKSQGKAETRIVEEVQIPCLCAGELLVGTVIWTHVVNKNVEHWNVQFGEMTGQTTHEKYRFVYVSSANNITIFRVIGEKGLVTYMQANAVTGENTFYCKAWFK